MTDYLAPEPAVDADANFRNFMRHNLAVAADRFGAVVSGQPRTGWLDRSISAPVERNGEPLWLRVVSDDPGWTHLAFWTGNEQANAITGVVKPRVLGIHEWPEQDWRHQRAELMTRLPGASCSPTDVLCGPLDLGDRWWNDLTSALHTVAVTPTDRVCIDQAMFDKRVHAAFGPDVRVEIRSWTTAHGDLHWANLMQPEFGAVDWEMWGRAPAGIDAATLYCFSLLEPVTAAKVHGVFADQLDTPDGRAAQLYVIARLHHRMAAGEFPELRAPLAKLAADLDFPPLPGS